MWKKTVLVLLSVCAVHAHAQDPACVFVITGNVIDEHDRTPLEFASVVIEGTTKGVDCDANGAFRLEHVCPGTLVLVVSHVGCDPVRRTIQVKADEDVEVRLEHHTEELKEFEIARERPDENVGQARAEVDRAGMERSTGRTLAEMLAVLPGVSTLSSGPTIGKPVINGLYGSRILTLNQGVRQEDQQWGTEHAPNLDPFSSDRITVVKGAAGVQYGSDALGGVIISEPVELPVEAGLRGELRSFGEWNGKGGGGNGMLEGGVKGWKGAGWRVQGSTRFLGDSEAPAYALSNTGVREAGASVGIGSHRLRYGGSLYYSWFGRELGILRASHIGNLTDLQNAIESGVPWYTADPGHAIGPPRQTVQHHLLKAQAEWRPGDRSQVEATYAYQADDRQEYDVRRGGRSDIPSIDLILATHTADLVLKHWLGAKVHGKVGASGVWQDNFNVPGTGIRPLIPNYTKGSTGVFLLEHYPLGERLELEGGARWEATGLRVSKYDAEGTLLQLRHDFVNQAVALGLNWSPTDSLRVRTSLATAFRPPNVSELYSEGLHHGAAAIERGDPDLEGERSVMASVDVQSAWLGGTLQVDATAYAHAIQGFIHLLPAGYELTIRGAFPVFQYTSTDARIAGIDASVRYRFAPQWSVRTRYSLVRGQDLSARTPLYLMPPDRLENAILFERPTAGSWRALSLALTHDHVLRQTRVPEGIDFSDPPAGYHLLGLSIDAMRPLGTGAFRIGLQCTNLLNTAYRDYLDRFRYYADARGADVVLWLRYAFGKPRI